jgi:hypothetical protein
VLVGIVALLVAGGAAAQIPPAGFAVDRLTLSGLGTSWIACEATWFRGHDRGGFPDVQGLSYRQLVRHANDGMPTHTLRDRFLAPLVASLRSWVRTPSLGEPPVRSAAPASVAVAPPPESLPPSTPETVTRELASPERVIAEIKGRLPYFQACANASRRRGGQELRRVLIVWDIAPDGSVKDLKVEGVSDAELSSCIHRVGRRPITQQPGAELSIPTPIVFVQ